jgi:hypothetical protein
MGFTRYLYIFNARCIAAGFANANLTTAVGATGANGGNAGLAVLDRADTGYPTTALVGPWTASSTWRVNFDIAGTGSWVDTVLPASLGGFAVIGANGKFYVFNNSSTSVYVGTPS